MLNTTINLYKKAYSGLSTNSWYLSLVMLVNRSGTMVIPFMTIYCTQQLHFSIYQAGIVMSLFGVGSITGAFIGGRITDKYGFYDVQVGALFSGGIGFLLLSLQTTFTGICIMTFILSLCNDAFRPANSTAVAHYSTAETRTRSYSLNRLAVNLGWAFGGALGGFLASVNYHLLFWVDGCTNIISGVLLLRLMPRVGYQQLPVSKTDHTLPTVSAYQDKTYLLFLALTTLFAMCFFQFFIMEPVFYKTQWHFSEQLIGFLLSLNGLLIVAVEMVMIHRINGKRNPFQYISFGVILTGAGFLLLNIMPASVWVAALVVIFITFGEMLSMPFMSTYFISRANAGNTGQYSALYSMAWSTAQILAPTLGSQLLLYGGYKLLWWCLGVICILSATGFLLMARTEPAREPGSVRNA